MNVSNQSEAEDVFIFLQKIIKYQIDYKDFFKNPRYNGYKGIHMKIIFDEKQRLEIRIRSAENILYKNIVDAINNNTEKEFIERFNIFIEGNALNNEMDFINNFIKIMVQSGFYDSLILMDNTTYFN